MRSRHYLPLLKIFEVFANLIIAIGITNTNYRKCSHTFDTDLRTIHKEEASQ
jgi:hypothetical protein